MGWHTNMADAPLPSPPPFTSPAFVFQMTTVGLGFHEVVKTNKAVPVLEGKHGTRTKAIDSSGVGA